MINHDAIALTVDTCVWIELVKARNAEPVLDSLERLVKEKIVSLVTPEQVVTEYLRNKPSLIDGARKRATQDIRRVKDIVRLHGATEAVDSIAAALDEVMHQLPSQSDTIARIADRVEVLLTECSSIPPTPNVIRRCANRALEKIAPFHNSKNNFADAVIIETFSEMVESSSKMAAMFVSYNTKEFSDPKDNRKPHAQLLDIFARPSVLYRTDLLAALREIDGELIDSVIDEFDWDQPSRRIQELIAAENQLVEQMWYGRHCSRMVEIERGDLLVVSEDLYTGERNQILDTIWEGALRSAEGVESRHINTEGFGDWDDFEWGMLNGKISALRWVLGEDWDELYT